MDWNAYGLLDILSGCYWSDDAQAGHINLLAGTGDGQFAAAVPLMTAANVPLVNLPPEATPETEQSETQAGETDAGETDAGESGDEGSDEASDPGSDVVWDNICTHQHAVDYDNDGDLDLVTGNIGNSFFVVENQGSPGSPLLAERPTKLEIASPQGHSSPHLVDWDGDGDLDLLTGSSEGGAYLSKNEGTRSTPQWSPFQQLIPGSSAHVQKTEEGPIVPAPSTRLWVVDWNHDGRLDILLGDSVTVATRKPGLTDEKFAELEAAYNKRMEEATANYSKISTEFFQAQEKGEISEELTDRFQKAQTEYSEVYSSKSEFVDEQRTGFVWLYLQQ